MATERLSALDLAFLCMENDAAPMHLGALAVFDVPPSFCPERVVALLGGRARCLPRLAQRVRTAWLPPGGAVWTDDRALDIDRHIHLRRLSSAGLADLAAVSGQLMAEPLDLSRPPWQLHAITGLAGGRFAVLAKFHHALCDAYGAIGLGRGLLDSPVPHERPAEHAPVPRPTAAAGGGFLPRPDRLVGAALHAASGAVSQARTALDIAQSIAGKVRFPPASPLLAAPTGARRVILARVGVPQLQRIRRRYGGTVHDVLLAVISGALRRWLLTRGDPVDGARALIPASQRRRSSTHAAGNQLSGYLCDLPVGEPDATRRLRQIHAGMQRCKAAGPNRGAGALPVLAGLLPHAVHRVVTPLAGRAAGWLFDLMITTVPLPATPLSLGDGTLRELYPLAPIAHGHALAIALSRYRDTVHIGLHADGEALPDIDKVVDALPAAVTELLEPIGA